MQGTIQAVKPTSTGKSLAVNVDGQTYYAKPMTNLGAHVGEKITFDPTTQQLPDGKVLTWINQFTLSGGSPAVNGGGMAASVQGPQAPASSYQSLVSNLAAHLIASGKSPTDLGPWFRACKNLLEGKTNADPEFDDDIPGGIGPGVPGNVPF